MTPNREIEIKLLIAMPDFPLRGEISCDDIEQTYLVSPEEITERVRRRGTKYFHTIKKRLTMMSADESEREINEGEYRELLKKRDPEKRTIRKTRHVIPYRGHMLEIDVFEFWKKTAMLEIELQSEDEKYELPDFIKVLRDVSEDKRYKNNHMAKEIPEE